MHRLFVALRPPIAARTRLLATMSGVPGARWQRDEQLHLTLAFIGEVERPVAEDIATTLQRITRPQPMVALAGVGAFGGKGWPHSLWAGCAPDAELSRLQAQVMRALDLAGARIVSRAFHPHVTLARLNRSAGPVEPFLARHAGLSLPPFAANAFFLFESRLGRDGAAYEAIARYQLG